MSLIMRYATKVIHYFKPAKKFHCAYCNSIFYTKDWTKTTRGYSTNCPYCPYSAWTPNPKFREEQ